MAETEREALFQVLDALEALQIPYMVVGSFASTFWGRPRLTHDVDLVVEIASHQIAELARLLAPHLSKLLWYRAAPVLDRQFRDAVEVYEIQEPYLEHEYPDHWARALGIADLLERVRQEAARPPDK